MTRAIRIDRRKRSLARRTGIVLVAALVCLLVVVLLAAGLLQSITAHQRLCREEVQQLQALWLAESAYERVTAQLAADETYSGESWRVSVGAIQGATESEEQGAIEGGVEKGGVEKGGVEKGGVEKGVVEKGVVEIRVTTPNDLPRERRVTIEARWPDVEVHRHVLRRNWNIQLPDSGDSP